MQLNISHFTGQPPQQKMIWFQMSVVLLLRNCRLNKRPSLKWKIYGLQSPQDRGLPSDSSCVRPVVWNKFLNPCGYYITHMKAWRLIKPTVKGYCKLFEIMHIKRQKQCPARGKYTSSINSSCLPSGENDFSLCLQPSTSEGRFHVC